MIQLKHAQFLNWVVRSELLMSVKAAKYSDFQSAVLAKKIHLNNAENSAVTMYFGVENPDTLISQKSVELYKQGEAIVNKVLETINE